MAEDWAGKGRAIAEETSRKINEQIDVCPEEHLTELLDAFVSNLQVNAMVEVEAPEDIAGAAERIADEHLAKTDRNPANPDEVNRDAK